MSWLWVKDPDGSPMTAVNLSFLERIWIERSESGKCLVRGRHGEFLYDLAEATTEEQCRQIIQHLVNARTPA